MFLRFEASPRKRFCGNDAVAMMPVACGSAVMGVVDRVLLCTRGREMCVKCMGGFASIDEDRLSLGMRFVSRLDSVGRLDLVLSNARNEVSRRVVVP